MQPRRDLEFIGVEKWFKGRKVLHEITLNVEAGEFIALLGPSGSGKSTLLKIAAGFERADRGNVFLQREDVTDTPPYLRNINTVFQNYALFPHMTVAENVAYGLRRKKVSGREITSRVSHALELVGLGHFGGRAPETLSGGEQQRIALARALVNRPAVLLLDEPLSALDLKIRRRMQGELKRIQRETATTFLFVTHDQEEALVMADRITVMRDGRLEQVGTPREIYHRPMTRFVADFVGETNWLCATFEDGSVRLADGTVLRSMQPPTSGDAVSVGVRPEMVTIRARGPAVDGHNEMPARVEKITFQGPNITVESRIVTGELLRCVCLPTDAAATALLVPGTEVICRWPIEATLLFPATPAVSAIAAAA